MTLLDRIAKGGQGEVWSAHDDDGNVYAVKVGDFKTLHTEWRALISVGSDHVVAGELLSEPTRKPALMAVEWIQGLTLAAFIRRHGPLPEEIASAITRQVCAGAEAIHQAGLVHRDIKPANVMLEQATGRVVLIDLGYAQPPGPQRATSGTMAHMSPEQSTGRSVSAADDVYAIQLLHAHMLLGRHPFRQHRETSVEAAAYIAESAEQTHRYATVAELVADLPEPAPSDLLAALARV